MLALHFEKAKKVFQVCFALSGRETLKPSSSNYLLHECFEFLSREQRINRKLECSPNFYRNWHLALITIFFFGWIWYLKAEQIAKARTCKLFWVYNQHLWVQCYNDVVIKRNNYDPSHFRSFMIIFSRITDWIWEYW